MVLHPPRRQVLLPLLPQRRLRLHISLGGSPIPHPDTTELSPKDTVAKMAEKRGTNAFKIRSRIAPLRLFLFLGNNRSIGVAIAGLRVNNQPPCSSLCLFLEEDLRGPGAYSTFVRIIFAEKTAPRKVLTQRRVQLLRNRRAFRLPFFTPQNEQN